MTSLTWKAFQKQYMGKYKTMKKVGAAWRAYQNGKAPSQKASTKVSKNSSKKGSSKKGSSEKGSSKKDRTWSASQLKYRAFFTKQRLAGKSPKAIGEMWKAQKGSTRASQKGSKKVSKKGSKKAS